MNVWWTVSVAGKSDWLWFSFLDQKHMPNQTEAIFLDIWFNFLQVLDLSSVQLVYSSSYFKSLSTGGNVSKALVRNLFFVLKLFPTRNLTSYNGKSKQIFHIIISRWELKGTLPKAREDVGYQGNGSIRTALVDWEDGAGFCLANQRMKWSKNKALDCWLMVLFFLP